jgi:phage major head subunit gpT-like protein
MREFKDELEFTALSDTNYTITNAIYASGVQFRRTDIDDNQMGTIRKRIQQMAVVASAHPNKLLNSLITSGTSSTCYDGAAFFANSHPARGAEGGAQDNLLAGTGTSTAAFADDFASTKAVMMGFKAENGEPFHGDGVGINFLVCVAPVLERPAREALSSQLISNTTNILAGQAEVIVMPRLAGNSWYLFATNAAAMPFIHQDREPLEFTADESGSDAFTKEIYKYKARVRYAQGYAYWQCAAKVVNS